jgi:hypothetical protein
MRAGEVEGGFILRYEFISGVIKFDSKQTNNKTFRTVRSTASSVRIKKEKWLHHRSSIKNFLSRLVRQKDFSPRLRILSPVENRTPTPLTL